MEKSEQLKTQPVSQLIVKLSAPAIISLLCNSVNMAIDRMFIAKGVGTLALSAVTIAFGLYLVIQACSQLIGAGASSATAIQLGKGKYDTAQMIVGNALVLSFLLAVVISVIGTLLLVPLLKLYGADTENISYAVDYAGIMFGGAIFFVLAQSMNSIVRGMGYAKRSLINFIASIIVNLILDAVFVFVFQWGVKGAALATVIGNCICTILAIQFLCSLKNPIRLHYQFMKPCKETIGLILSIGVSGFIGQFALSLDFSIQSCLSNLWRAYRCCSIWYHFHSFYARLYAYDWFRTGYSTDYRLQLWLPNVFACKSHIAKSVSVCHCILYIYVSHF